MRPTILSLAVLLSLGVAASSRADDHQGRGNVPVATQERPQVEERPAARLDPNACASLCRFFEFLGSLERPTPAPSSVPTS